MVKTIVIELINFYQRFLSFDTGILSVFAPGGACKHSPRCSEYTKNMVKQYGVVKGLFMGGGRILTCR